MWDSEAGHEPKSNLASDLHSGKNVHTMHLVPFTQIIYYQGHVLNLK